MVDSPAGEPKARKERLNSVSVPDYIKFAMFGLGCGADASNPSPLSCSAKKVTVRSIHPKLENLNEHLKRERHSYKETISSLDKHKSSVTASVSDIVGEVVTLRGEAEYKRENSSELYTSGEKEITRSLSFKPFSSHSGSNTWPKDSDFEENFCSYLIARIPEIKAAAGSTVEEKVNTFLKASQSNFEQGLMKAYDYIKSEKITHYINGIDLGAAVYSIGISKSNVRSKKLDGEIGVEILAGVGAGVSSKKERTYKNRRKFSIGNFDHLKLGGGEGVLEYSLRPLFTLVRDEHSEIRRVLQKAIRFYLDRNRGPFIISCMHKDRAVYWKVDSDRVRNTLVGTTNMDEAAIFYIEKHCRPGEFNIAYYGETKKKTFSNPTGHMSNYVSAKSKITSGRHVGPLLVEGSAAKLTLRHPIKKRVPSVEDWERDACYIKLAPRKTQMKSYIAFDISEDIGESMCVESLPKGQERNLAMRFMLTRVGIDTCSRFSAIPASKTIDSSDRLNSDSAEPISDDVVLWQRLDSYLFQGTEDPAENHSDQEENVPPQVSTEIKTSTQDDGQISHPEGENPQKDQLPQEEGKGPQASNESEYESDISDQDLDYDDSD